MVALTSIELPLATNVSYDVARLIISVLPKSPMDPPPIVDVGNETDRDVGLPPIQLIEGHEYRYEWRDLPPHLPNVTTDPEEVFQPDTNDGRQGRLRPGLATGLLRVVLRSDDAVCGELELEVRSRKLTYRSEYRWMLRDIADQMAELVMHRFAASATHFRPDATRGAITLYQRFEFLRALLSNEITESAFREIARRPHVAWEESSELIGAGRPVRATEKTIRQFSRPGFRVSWPGGPLPFLPHRIENYRTEATTDTVPNRFVRFALERWRQVVADILKVVEKQSGNSLFRRAKREIEQVLAKLDEHLNSFPLKGLGSLARFPADNQVLQRREGYRDIFRAYLEFELAALLSWEPTEGNYTAGQRDVAQLYEYWAFLQLAGLVAQLVGAKFDVSSVLQLQSGELSIGLSSGKQTVISGEITRRGRRLRVELCFNREFKSGESWTMTMRPDYSLIVSPIETTANWSEPVMLHFDAKYRVNYLREIFRPGAGGSDDPTEPQSRSAGGFASAKRDDLLKMHAYRDAIHRSAGAYVLFPGDEETTSNSNYSEYQELLPGLGAFVLRPAEGEPVGTCTLKNFLDEVLDHLATRLTRHGRGRYWLRESYMPYQPKSDSVFECVAVEPSPSTSVLIGFVKSEQHWSWIQERMTYNVRSEGRSGGVGADSTLLYSSLLLLYGPDLEVLQLARIVSGPEFVEREEMVAINYPEPRGDYHCVQISWIRRPGILKHVNARTVDEFVMASGVSRGTPITVSWGKVCSM